MNRFDVLFYVPTIAPLLAGDTARPPGGAETQVRLLTQALAMQGLRVAVVAFDQPGLPDADGGVTVVPRPPRSANPLREMLTIAGVLRRHPADVVVTRQAGGHTGIAAVTTRASRRRFVYSAANVLDFAFSTWEPRKAQQALFETALRLAHEVVAQTDEQRELGRRKLGRDLPVIRSLAEPADMRTGVPEAFLWAGRVVDYKQPLAYLELAREVPEATFWMVAVPDDAWPADRSIREQLERSAPEVPNLVMLPPCPRAELLERMGRAVAVVSTSSSEGMPNIWLEGWIRGVPALTLAHDPDALVEQHGLGVAASGDPARLAEAARSMWAGRHDQAVLADRCRTYAHDHHSPAAAATRWRQVLQPSAGAGR